RRPPRRHRKTRVPPRVRSEPAAQRGLKGECSALGSGARPDVFRTVAENLVGSHVCPHHPNVDAQPAPTLRIDHEDAERPTAGKSLAQRIGVGKPRGEAKRPGARGRDETGWAGDDRGPRGIPRGRHRPGPRCAEIRGTAGREIQTMSSGRTQRSYCSAVTWPEARAASRSVSPSAWALLAIAAARS